MKNFKKLLSVLVMLAMLASFVPASTAASYIYEDQAIILNNLGIFKGSSATSFVPDLGGAVTREQGVIQLVRTLGKEADAIAMTDVDADKILIVFSDAKTISSWSKKYIAWAVNNKIVAGYPNGKFGPQDALSGKAYAKLLLSALGHTVDAAGFEAACFLMRDKGIMTWGTRGTLYYVLSFSEAQKFNDKEALVRDDLVALSYAALKLPYSNTYVTTTLRNKTAIQALIEAGKVTKDKAIAAYLYFKELMPLTEAAVAAYEAAPVNSLAAITAAEALKVTADTAVAEYVKGNVAGLAAIVNFNVKFNLNNAWVKADYDGFLARIAAKATAVANAKTAETAAQAAANAALAAYEAAPITTLAEIAAAEALGVAAANAINACVDAAFKTAKLATKAAKDSAVAAAKALMNSQIADATAALAAYKAAPLTTPAEIDAALALFITADAKILAVADPVAKADLTAQLNAVPVVAGLKAIDTKTLKVNFNRILSDAQKAAAAFTAKYTNNAFITKPIVWTGNNVSIMKNDGEILYAGNYSVEITGINTTVIIANTTVEAEKAVSITIDTDVLLQNEYADYSTLQSYSDSHVLPISVYNQYGLKMTTLPGLQIDNINLTDLDDSCGDFWVSGNQVWYDLCCEDVGDKVRVTIFLSSNPEISATKVLTVVETYPMTLTFGEALNTNGTTPARLVPGVEYYVAVTVKDNLGIDIIPSCCLDDGNLSYIMDGSVNLSNTDGWDLQSPAGKLAITFGTTGTAKIIALNPYTGATTTKTFTVVAAPVLTSVTLTSIAPVRANAASVVVAYDLKDQYGTVLADNPAVLTFGSSNATIAVLEGSGTNVVVNPALPGTVTLTATVTSTGQSSSIVVTVLPDGVPSYISLSGTPRTTMYSRPANYTSSDVTTDLKFTVKNQDGGAMNLTGNYKLKLSTSGAVALSLGQTILTSANMSSTAGTTNAVTVTADAATVGAASIMAELFNDANTNDVMDAGEAVGSVVVVPYTVVAPALTTGIITNIAGGTSTVVADTAFANAYINTTAGDKVVTVTYQLRDQINRPFLATAAVTVTRTVSANATAGAVPANVAVGSSTTSFTLTGPADGKVDVSVNATGVVADTAALYFSNIIVNSAGSGYGNSYNGTVAAVCKNGDWAVINTAVGYVVVTDYTMDVDDTYVVDGNTANDTQFENNISVGDSLAVSMSRVWVSTGWFSGYYDYSVNLTLTNAAII